MPPVTVAKIKQDLGVMLQFAPLLMNLADIIATAENAELVMKDLERAKQEAAAEIEDMRKEIPRIQQQIQQAKDEEKQAVLETDARKDELLKERQAALTETDKAKEALLIAQTEHATAVKAMDKDLAAKQKQLDDLKNEIKKLTDKFAPVP